MRRCIGRCRIDSGNGHADGSCKKWAQPGRLTCHWHHQYEWMVENALGRIVALENSIAARGFSVMYQDYCECADTPGFPGQIRGVTDRAKYLVRISRKANETAKDLIEILEHELHHVEDPDWDCGNRDVFGRGHQQQGRK